MYTVYILRCGDGSLYTGCTNDLPRRLRMHQTGKGAKYTRSRPPVELVYQEPAADRSQALRREAAIKSLSRSEKLRLVRQYQMKEVSPMRQNFGPKPFTYPQPVFIIATYGEDGTPDAMNAAWGGINDTTEVAICLSSGHKTVQNLLKRGAFTVSMADAAHVAACDYLGIVSANDVPDKLSRAGFHVTHSPLVDAPIIDELPMCLECTLKSYDPESGHLVGEIVNVSVDERCLTDGKVNVKKLAPITFDPMNSAYLALGEQVGRAFSDGAQLKE